MALFSRAMWGLRLALFSAGCGATRNTGTAEAVAESNFPGAFAQALCDAMQPCCAAAGFAYDASGCLSEGRSEGLDFVREGVPYDADKAGACILQVQQLSGSCFVSDPEKHGIQDACGRVYARNGSLGDACGSAKDCAPAAGGATACSFMESTGESVCTAQPYGQRGDYCIGFAAPALDAPPSRVYFLKCDPLLHCGLSSQCVAILAEGEKCDPMDPGACGAGLGCDVASSMCVTLKKAGAPCISSLECSSGTCIANLCTEGETLVTKSSCLGQPDAVQ